MARAGWAADLERILQELDSCVRLSALRAHRELMEEAARTESVTIGDVQIDGKAMLPADLFAPDSLKMRLSMFIRNNGVSFSRSTFGGGVRAEVELEWKNVKSPEASALVRTKAESDLAKQIQHGS